MLSEHALNRPQAVPRRRNHLSIHFRASQKHVTSFTRQFATLLDAGLPVVRSLDILEAQQKPGLLKLALAEVKEDVEGGAALSEAMSKHSVVFDRLYVNMVRAGEAGGVLDEILSRLADYREKALRLQQRILGALVYPAAVITIAAGILCGIMVFIIPRFQQMFQEMGLELPPMTRVLMWIANTVGAFWYVLLFTPLLVWAGVRFAAKTPPGRLIVDRIKLSLPVFGMILSKSAISRFCRTLGTLVQSGVPILDALGIIQNATGNVVVANAVGNVRNSIKEGDTIAEPLRHCGVFDDLVVNMIQVGEETGELDRMLIKVADTYDGEVDTLVAALMSLLEPMLIVGLGGMVGFIVLALFMPILEMMKNFH